jgi:formyltetrahydrofolate deformylase
VLPPINKHNKARAGGGAVALLDQERIDLSCSRATCRSSAGLHGRYPNRIINIHHSFLPAFIGQQALPPRHERGVKLIGCHRPLRHRRLWTRGRSSSRT